MGIKDDNLLQFVMENTDINEPILFNYLLQHYGGVAIVPIKSDETVTVYNDGSQLKNYDFMVQAMFNLSDTTDTVNTDNLSRLRKWQQWFREQDAVGNYPDFGEDCQVIEIENLTSPLLEESFDRNMGKYYFTERISYIQNFIEKN